MSTTSPTAQPADHDAPALHATDAAAVLEHFASGQPLDSALVARVRARAEQVTADIRREHGLVDDDTFHALLDDEA